MKKFIAVVMPLIIILGIVVAANCWPFSRGCSSGQCSVPMTRRPVTLNKPKVTTKVAPKVIVATPIKLENEICPKVETKIENTILPVVVEVKQEDNKECKCGDNCPCQAKTVIKTQTVIQKVYVPVEVHQPAPAPQFDNRGPVRRLLFKR
jgi:hypothetical protein